MSLLFDSLSRFVIAFHLRSNHLLISRLQSPSTVLLELRKRKSVTASTFSLFVCHEVVGLDAMILGFWILSFKPAFSLSSFTLIERLFGSSLLTAIREVSSAYLRLLIFLPAILIPACDSFSQAFSVMYSAYGLYTVHEVLTASALGWSATPSSSGSRFVRTLCYGPSILGGPAWHGS